MKLLVLLAALLAAAVAPAPASAARAQRLRLRRHSAVGGDASGSWGASAGAVAIGGAGRKRSEAEPPLAPTRLRYVLRLLDEFKTYASASQQRVDSYHVGEALRLKAALGATQDAGVRLALEQSVTSNEQSLVETERIYDNMVGFADSLAGLLREASTRGSHCQQTTCGPHASCTDTVDGAHCVCHEGYVGTGQDCRAPPEFRPQRLIQEGSTSLATVATEIHVCVYETSKVAVVFVDTSKGRDGRIVVGSVREAGLAALSPPEQFTAAGSKAFDPVVQGSPDKRLLIAWRDESRGGVGWVRGAAVGNAQIRGADMAITWGQPLNIAKDQGHKMAMVAVGNNHFAVMHSDKVEATTEDDAPPESFGSALLAEAGAGGEVSILGRYRFTDYAVCRLEVTKVTPTAFVVAARAAPQVDDDDGNGSAPPARQEAMAIYGEAVDGDLVFDPNPVNLEPLGGEIWARGVSLIAPHTFAYAYQQGGDPKMKLGVVEIDPTTHRMKVVQQPVVFHSGFSPYVSMLSVPYTTADPHTLTYYESGNFSMVSVCAWEAKAKKVDRCEDLTWLVARPTSVSGVHLGGGKAFMAFAVPSGTPFYSVFGLSKK